jgi:hypothetical protein
MMVRPSAEAAPMEVRSLAGVSGLLWKINMRGGIGGIGDIQSC